MEENEKQSFTERQDAERKKLRTQKMIRYILGAVLLIGFAIYFFFFR